MRGVGAEMFEDGRGQFAIQMPRVLEGKHDRLPSVVHLGEVWSDLVASHLEGVGVDDRKCNLRVSSVSMVSSTTTGTRTPATGTFDSSVKSPLWEIMRRAPQVPLRHQRIFRHC